MSNKLYILLNQHNIRRKCSKICSQYQLKYKYIVMKIIKKSSGFGVKIACVGVSSDNSLDKKFVKVTMISKFCS